MQPKQTIDQNETIEAVVGVFDTAADASRVAASLRGPDIRLQRVSRTDAAASDEMPDITYDEIEQIESSDVTDGILQGGAIGAGSGLLFLGFPGLNVAAPVAGMLVGAWIGAVASVDEARRAMRLPDELDYHQMLIDGKSFVVIAGDEATRLEYGKKMQQLGASQVFQHPPVQQAVRKPN